MIGGKFITTFYPTNAGWYRIMAPSGNGISELSGRVSITSPYDKEDIEMEVSCTRWTVPWINVTRCKQGVHVISQARAITYADSTLGGEWHFVDVYVSNPLPVSATGKLNRLTVSMDSDVSQPVDATLVGKLLSPVIPVSATPPAGANVTTVNTYR